MWRHPCAVSDWGKTGRTGPACLRTQFDPSIKISLVIDSCYEDEKDRVVLAECGHYMCSSCWKKWVKSRPLSVCWVCSKTIERYVYARFRDSPCPVDHCRSGDTPRDYVLVPCG
ncbi:hypothetical protein COOONC_24157 [Cooperia oncophora]